jgi:uncharacterized protein (DUF305 family)
LAATSVTAMGQRGRPGTLELMANVDPRIDPRVAGADDEELLAAGSGDGGEDDDVIVLSWWQHPLNVVALVVATALIAGMLGWLVGDDRQAERGGEVDVGFLHDMRVHHEQAVEMAYIYLDLEDTAPGLRTVAGGILLGQNIEIGRMIQMLRDMGRPEAAESDMAMTWMGMATTHAEMPGMATPEQLDELAASSGAAADELFVELMVAHHEAGVHMAQLAADDADLAKVRSLARSIAEGQRGEIAELELLVD